MANHSEYNMLSSVEGVSGALFRHAAIARYCKKQLLDPNHYDKHLTRIMLRDALSDMRKDIEVLHKHLPELETMGVNECHNLIQESMNGGTH